jgi:hypothetical protein
MIKQNNKIKTEVNKMRDKNNGKYKDKSSDKGNAKDSDEDNEDR